MKILMRVDGKEFAKEVKEETLAKGYIDIVYRPFKLIPFNYREGKIADNKVLFKKKRLRFYNNFMGIDNGIPIFE